MITPPEIADAAIAAQKKWRVPASSQIAQWRLESGNGVHQPGNNPFGLKCRAGKGDPSQLLMTTEFSKERGFYKIPQAFRRFDTIADAFDAHAELLATAKVYAPAMAKLPDRDGFIEAMAARYATDPLYAAKLEAMIRQSNLGAYDA
jgi:flagellum-specific peptidoglycan hydrolase FlgJ